MGRKRLQIIGEKFCNSKGQEYVVLDYADNPNGFDTRVKVRFLNTGYETDALARGAVKGLVKDPYAISLAGIGYFGEPNDYVVKRDKKEYNLWSHMITKSYSLDSSSYIPGYTVCDRWHSFANFLDDIRKMDYYNEWKNSNKEYSFGIDPYATEYNPQTCGFAYRSTYYNNNDYRSTTEYIGVYRTGENSYRMRYYNKDIRPNGPVTDTTFNNAYSAAVYHDACVDHFGTLTESNSNHVPISPMAIIEALRNINEPNNKKVMYHLIDESSDNK